MKIKHIRHRDVDMILTFDIRFRLLNHEYIISRHGLSKRAFQVADMAKITTEEYKKAADTLQVIQ